jgi:ADP-ribose pyrophosphatase YjhB (NUDIX family)
MAAGVALVREVGTGKNRAPAADDDAIRVDAGRRLAPRFGAGRGCMHEHASTAGRQAMGTRLHCRAMLQSRPIKHCRRCGTAVDYRVPPEDNRARAVCPACGEIHYENPLNVVGTLPVWGEQVLLCRRAIEPRRGLWTLPAGFMELGETVAEGAVRETTEEAGARIALDGLFAVMNVVPAGQVHFFYRARMLDETLDPGPETLEARLFREDEIPWEQIAFRTVRQTLQHYFDCRRSGQYTLHCADIT